jgi:hypothetical protein
MMCVVHADDAASMSMIKQRALSGKTQEVGGLGFAQHRYVDYGLDADAKRRVHMHIINQWVLSCKAQDSDLLCAAVIAFVWVLYQLHVLLACTYGCQATAGCFDHICVI